MKDGTALGIIGSGALGGAIASGLLSHGAIAPESLWIANRSGARKGFESWPGITVTTNTQDLVDNCSTMVLAVPPAAAGGIGISAADHLIVSVMAGVTAAALREITGSNRVVRAMSNPAADRGIAYSPWWAAPGVTAADKETVKCLFEAIGESDEVPAEDQIDRFTAMTGPVPGFVAYFAQCMVDHAKSHGVDENVAVRAIRQLFYAGAGIMADEEGVPSAYVREMIDYDGTTAAGLRTMIESPLSKAVADGLDAAYRRAKTIA